MIKLQRRTLFVYLLSFFLAYSTIAGFSIYYVGVPVKSAMVLLLCILGLKVRPKIVKNNIEALLFLWGWGLVYLMSTIINGARPGLMHLNSFLFCYFVLLLSKDIQREVFNKFVWLLTFLVLLSAIEYIVYSVTGKGVVLTSVTRSTDYRETNFNHLLFNVIRLDLIILRFQGLFKEPGNMGTTCAFMLFATWKIKSMKIPFIIFLICGLLSLSLAFYIFLLVFLFSNVKPNIKNMIMLTLITIPLLYVFKDNFEYKIIERVDNADSPEELDNRTSDSFDRSFAKAFENGDLWLGVGIGNVPESVSVDGGNAGGKPWIYQYGILSFIIVFYIFSVIYYRRCNKCLTIHDWVFLLVYWACFYKSVVFMTPSIFMVYIMMPMINGLSEYECKKEDDGLSPQLNIS